MHQWQASTCSASDRLAISDMSLDGSGLKERLQASIHVSEIKSVKEEATVKSLAMLSLSSFPATHIEYDAPMG
jgi:hypothetical protein